MNDEEDDILKLKLVESGCYLLAFLRTELSKGVKNIYVIYVKR